MLYDIKQFLDASLDDMKKGYVHKEKSDTYTCLICGKTFINGRIYDFDGHLFEAKKAIKQHIAKEHSSVFEILLDLDKKYTGLTDHQKNLLKYFFNDYSDKEICAEIGGSTSTIRNYRFSFKEKEKQAKVLLAILELLKEQSQRPDDFVPFPQSAELVDDRFTVTRDEYNKVLKLCFQEGLNGPLTHFPKKQKRKLIVLNHIIKRLDKKRSYTEKELNSLLEEIYPDYVTIRRYLVDYGFLDRMADGSIYWLN